MGYKFIAADAYDFASRHGHEIKPKGKELEFKYCPFCKGGKHSDEYTFSVNSENGAFKCMRQKCGRQGHFAELAREFGFNDIFANEILKEYTPMKPSNINFKLSATEKAAKYLETRGIDPEITKYYEVSSRDDNANTILVFPLYDENKVLYGAKYRNPEDKQRKEWFEPNSKHLLYGMWLKQHPCGTVVVTEGQIDALSVAMTGNFAVSVPGGCKDRTYLEHSAEWLSKFDKIIIFGDNENGKITLVDDIVEKIKKPIYCVRPIDYLGEKDANDILQKYGVEALRKTVENAEIVRIKKVKFLSEVKKVDISALPKLHTNLYDLDRVLEGGITFGQLVVVTGKRGKGKSTFMSQLLCEALNQNHSFFAYSGEMQAFLFRSWLDMQLAGSEHITKNQNQYGDYIYSVDDETRDKIGEWYKDKAMIYDYESLIDDEPGEETESLLSVIERAVLYYGVKVVLVDNLMTAMQSVSAEEDIYRAQQKFVISLQHLAMKHDIIIFLVAHKRKNSASGVKQSAENDEISGSSVITDAAHIVMSYEKNENPTEPYSGVVTVTKNRMTGRVAVGESEIHTQYDVSARRIYINGADMHKYGWEEEKPFPELTNEYNELL